MRDKEPVVSVYMVIGHLLHFVDRGSSWYVFKGHFSHLLFTSYVPAVHDAIHHLQNREMQRDLSLKFSTMTNYKK